MSMCKRNLPKDDESKLFRATMPQARGTLHFLAQLLAQLLAWYARRSGLLASVAIAFRQKNSVFVLIGATICIRQDGPSV